MERGAHRRPIAISLTVVGQAKEKPRQNAGKNP